MKLPLGACRPPSFRCLKLLHVLGTKNSISLVVISISLPPKPFIRVGHRFDGASVTFSLCPEERPPFTLCAARVVLGYISGRDAAALYLGFCLRARVTDKSLDWSLSYRCDHLVNLSSVVATAAAMVNFLLLIYSTSIHTPTINTTYISVSVDLSHAAVATSTPTSINTTAVTIAVVTLLLLLLTLV
ncbi:hypothetical protein NDU88_001097 [Pleurodeles waltl]|uniref:Uncharacterized protein n=1 Tax=Pleurodeles waltl TaxID=8319 RepID=A0AAV7VAC3_PLEWA|nr:hypothetical protein NDU88_001097 [Pleurodeles waltl]